MKNMPLIEKKKHYDRLLQIYILNNYTLRHLDTAIQKSENLNEIRNKNNNNNNVKFRSEKRNKTVSFKKFCEKFIWYYIMIFIRFKIYKNILAQSVILPPKYMTNSYYLVFLCQFSYCLHLTLIDVSGCHENF